MFNLETLLGYLGIFISGTDIEVNAFALGILFFYVLNAVEFPGEKSRPVIWLSKHTAKNFVTISKKIEANATKFGVNIIAKSVAGNRIKFENTNKAVLLLR